ncbi:TPA: hypothetical protein VB846_002304, partial [Streptococcus suis]|nr:hypothetical protein [Streptococcus suis]
FYTQLKDIEKELRHYRHHFKDKIVYCNADDPRISNFFHYFSYNFEYLGLKKLITTCYKNQEMDLFSMHDHESAIALIYEGEKDNGKVPTVENIGVIELSGDGDFRSPEAVEFLEEADIIVTNPPFSLWREYVAQLIEYEKKFIIIGNTNAITYKEIFPYLKDNKMWIGRTNFNVGMYFYVPDDYEQYHKIENGRKMVRVSTSCWYTNLEHNKRNEQLVLTKFYEGNEDKYPYYDNYNAIEVGTYKDIPMDYDGVMGVPITFIDKYNPEQFEILGSDNYDGTPPTKKYGKKKRVSAFLFKSC